MNTGLPPHFVSQAPANIFEANTKTAKKFAAALENARKAYLRTLYGNQPANGRHWGHIHYAKAKGSVVSVEIYFLTGSQPLGVFELPIHVFKQDGKAITNSAAVQKIVGRDVNVVVAGRYKFNGISLSDVTAIEFDTASNAVPSVDKQTNAAQR